MTSNPGFLDLLLDGHYLPAIGVALIAFVAIARASLASFWPWFATKPGGYVLGFGTAGLLYLGEAWRSGAGLSVGILTAALGAGWAASGGFEMVRDLYTWWKNRPKPPAVTALLVTCAALLVACSSCREIKDSHPVEALVDCTKASRDKIEALGIEMIAALGGGGWQAVKEQAVNAGIEVGGCALAELVQSVLSGRKALAPDESWTARRAFDDYRRTVAGNATFRTAGGDL